MSKRRIAIPIMLTGAGLSLVALGLYQFRRHILAWLLKLPPVQNDVAVERNIAVPMPDGVALMADHYIPKAEEDLPTILLRSPYGRGAEAGPIGRFWIVVAERFAERGYHVLVQGTRGRYDSGGEFDLLRQEAADGQATLEWIARQPWFNGVLGMWGPSYLGYVQWAVAAAAPPYLKALVPIITFSNAYNATYLDGAFALDTALRVALLFEESGRDRRAEKEAQRRWAMQGQILPAGFGHLPIQEADAVVVGRPARFYREGLAHPQPGDPFWEVGDHHAGIAGVTAATHLISGWYDFFLRDLLADYAALKGAGRPPYLTIGPWYHMDLRWLPDAIREGITWFDAQLKGQPQRLREKPVRLYVLGAEEWREVESWPPPATSTPCFLHAGGQLSGAEPEPSSSPDRYHYDPADPTPVLRGALFIPPAGPVDNRPLEARPDVLCYTTPPLQSPVEVIGPVRLVLYVRSSREHTDFYGRLCDVYPDGRSINICDGLFRIAPGQGERQPDGTLRIEVDLWATACRFLAGHRLRLQVSSGAHPRWNRNLGLGEPQGTATRMAAADQAVYHDREHPSALVLPIV